jgi:hypothetical protein
MSVTYKAVQEKLREIGIVISKRGDVHRINFFGGLESTAHYTTSLRECLEKGEDMAKPAKARHMVDEAKAIKIAPSAGQISS